MIGWLTEALVVLIVGGIAVTIGIWVISPFVMIAGVIVSPLVMIWEQKRNKTKEKEREESVGCEHLSTESITLMPWAPSLSEDQEVARLCVDCGEQLPPRATSRPAKFTSAQAPTWAPTGASDLTKAGRRP
jgi:hypothetical protein